MAIFIDQSDQWDESEPVLYAPDSHLDPFDSLPFQVMVEVLCTLSIDSLQDIRGKSPKGKAVFLRTGDNPTDGLLYVNGPEAGDDPETAEKTLSECYASAVRLASEKGFRLLHVPCISSELAPFPRHRTLLRFLPELSALSEKYDVDIRIHAGRPNKALRSIDEAAELSDYLEKNYIPRAAKVAEPKPQTPPPAPRETGHGGAAKRAGKKRVAGNRKIVREPVERTAYLSFEEILPDLQAALSVRKDSFSTTLLRYANKSGLTDAEIYKRANIDRRLFSKMKKPDYQPSKETIFALCIAMKLTIDETKNLLEQAGYAISAHRKTDLIVAYFIEKNFYDIDLINQALFTYQQNSLGSK